MQIPLRQVTCARCPSLNEDWSQCFGRVVFKMGGQKWLVGMLGKLQWLLGSSKSCQPKYTPIVFSLLRLHFGLNLIPRPQSFNREALYARYQWGNIIITKIEAGTIKSFHFNLEIQDEEFNINSISQLQLGHGVLQLIALRSLIQLLEKQVKYYSDSK